MKFYSLLLLLLIHVSLFAQMSDSLLTLVESAEIASLSSTEKQKEFLTIIFKTDQEIRTEWKIAEMQLQKESEKYKRFWDKLCRTDSILFMKTKEYLDEFKHPNKEHGDLACYTPQLIFHHASLYNFPNLLELKTNYFPLFYKAYQKDNLEQNAIWFYLFRLYQQVEKQTYVNYELGDAAQIEEMIDLLNLKRN